MTSTSGPQRPVRRLPLDRRLELNEVEGRKDVPHLRTTRRSVRGAESPAARVLVSEGDSPLAMASFVPASAPDKPNIVAILHLSYYRNAWNA